MGTSALRYDHPTYIANQVYSGVSTAGANGVTTKFAAFTAMKLLAVVATPFTASTSASQPVLYVKSGTNTTTATMSALTSAAITPAYTALNATLAQGDVFWVAHGTDATVALAVAIEARVLPNAIVTTP